MNSNKQETREPIKYTKKDIEHIEKWGKYQPAVLVDFVVIQPLTNFFTVERHVETTWHCLGTCSMAPREGNSIVKHGVLDERLNVHGVKGLKVSDLSICPDNVGCNTFSVSFCIRLALADLLLTTLQTALLIGEKAAVLTAEDLGYSGSALDMKIPTYHAPGEIVNLARL